jgi:hypothetical protein
MTAAVGVYFFFILGIMEFKGNTYLTNVLQYVPCEGTFLADGKTSNWDAVNNFCIDPSLVE